MTSWQDALFGLGGFFFALSMLPTIRDKRASVPLTTSAPTAAILASYVVAEWTIGLHLAAIAGVLTAGAWTTVAIMRRPKGPWGKCRCLPGPDRDLITVRGCPEHWKRP